MYTQITCSGKPTQSKVFHGLIHYYTNADNWLVCCTWLSGPIRAERTVMCTKDMFRLNMMFWRLYVICDAATGSAALRSRAHRHVSWDAIAAADGNPKHPEWRGWDSRWTSWLSVLKFVSLSVSSSIALFLSISPVLIVQQHNWLHHVSEHHNCHIKHGWVCAYICVSAIEHAPLC